MKWVEEYSFGRIWQEARVMLSCLANVGLIWRLVGDVASGVDMVSLIWLVVHVTGFYRQ